MYNIISPIMTIDELSNQVNTLDNVQLINRIN